MRRGRRGGPSCRRSCRGGCCPRRRAPCAPLGLVHLPAQHRPRAGGTLARGGQRSGMGIGRRRSGMRRGRGQGDRRPCRRRRCTAGRTCTGRWCRRWCRRRCRCRRRRRSPSSCPAVQVPRPLQVPAAVALPLAQLAEAAGGAGRVQPAGCPGRCSRPGARRSTRTAPGTGRAGPGPSGTGRQVPRVAGQGAAVAALGAGQIAADAVGAVAALALAGGGAVLPAGQPGLAGAGGAVEPGLAVGGLRAARAAGVARADVGGAALRGPGLAGALAVAGAGAVFGRPLAAAGLALDAGRVQPAAAAAVTGAVALAARDGIFGTLVVGILTAGHRRAGAGRALDVARLTGAGAGAGAADAVRARRPSRTGCPRRTAGRWPASRSPPGGSRSLSVAARSAAASGGGYSRSGVGLGLPASARAASGARASGLDREGRRRPAPRPARVGSDRFTQPAATAARPAAWWRSRPEASPVSSP